MAYNEFTMEEAEARLGVRARPADLFPGLQEVAVPDWLRDFLARGMQLALVSEKARSEFTDSRKFPWPGAHQSPEPFSAQ